MKKNYLQTFLSGILVLSGLYSGNVNAQCSTTFTPATSCTSGDYINTFTLNTVASPVSTGCSSGAYLYSALPKWNFIPGASNSFTATMGPIYTQGLAIWIDLNQDGIYSASEQMVSTAPSLTVNGVFTVPVTALSGQTRMRVRCRYATTIPNGATTACDAWTWGETEDYLVTINGGEALNFDGVDDFVTASDPNFGTGDFTVEGWFKSLNTNGAYLLTSRTSEMGAAGNWWSLSSNGSQVSVELAECGVAGGYSVISTPANVITVGSWNHVAVVRAGMGVKIYINGVLQATFVDSFLRNLITGANVLRFGAWPEPNAAWLNGSMDEVRTWNVARTQCQINTFKNSEIPTTAPGLLANYHFNQGINAANNPTVTSLTDASASANNGTLSNFALTTGTISNWIAPGGVISGYTAPLANPLGSTATPSAVCMGGSTTLNGTGANTYSWTNSVTNGVTFTPTATATYVLSGTVLATTCTYTASRTVTVNPLPVISVNSGFVCAGKSFTMVPSGASTYTFSNGSAITSPTANASYSVTGTSVAGCVSSTPAVSNVTVNALPVVSSSVSNSVICSGATTTLTATGANTYTWTGGAVNGASFSPTVTGSYSVTGTSTVTGCTSTNSAVQSITVNSVPVLTVNSGTICSGNSFTMVPTGASTYTFSNGSPVVTPTINATYSVTGTSTNGCVSPAAVVSTVIVNATPVISVNSGAICSGSSFTMVPSGASTYTFSNGSAVVTPTANASYSVAGTSTAGCMSSVPAISNVSVTTPPSVVVNSGAICAGNSFTMNPTGAATYTFSNGSAVATPSGNSTYTVTGSTPGCPGTSAAVSNVTVNSLPVVTAVSNTSLICSGQTASLTGNGAVSYTWNTSATSSIIAVSPTVTTTYTVTGNDANGCANSATITQNVSACTGIASAKLNSEISIYPNPSTGMVTVNLGSLSGFVTIEVYNTLGQLVLTHKSASANNLLDITNQANGVYSIRILDNQGLISVTRIVKH